MFTVPRRILLVIIHKQSLPAVIAAACLSLLKDLNSPCLQMKCPLLCISEASSKSLLWCLGQFFCFFLRSRFSRAQFDFQVLETANGSLEVYE